MRGKGRQLPSFAGYQRLVPAECRDVPSGRRKRQLPSFAGYQRLVPGEAPGHAFRQTEKAIAVLCRSASSGNRWLGRMEKVCDTPGKVFVASTIAVIARDRRDPTPVRAKPARPGGPGGRA